MARARSVMAGVHHDPRRAAVLDHCAACKHTTIHTRYDRGAVSAYRCRRCSAWRRWRTPDYAAVRAALAVSANTR